MEQELDDEKEKVAEGRRKMKIRRRLERKASRKWGEEETHEEDKAFDSLGRKAVINKQKW